MHSLILILAGIFPTVLTAQYQRYWVDEQFSVCLDSNFSIKKIDRLVSIDTDNKFFPKNLKEVVWTNLVQKRNYGEVSAQKDYSYYKYLFYMRVNECKERDSCIQSELYKYIEKFGINLEPHSQIKWNPVKVDSNYFYVDRITTIKLNKSVYRTFMCRYIYTDSFFYEILVHNYGSNPKFKHYKTPTASRKKVKCLFRCLVNSIRLEGHQVVPYDPRQRSRYVKYWTARRKRRYYQRKNRKAARQQERAAKE